MHIKNNSLSAQFGQLGQLLSVFFKGMDLWITKMHDSKVLCACFGFCGNLSLDGFSKFIDILCIIHMK